MVAEKAFAGFQLGEVAGIPVLWKRDMRFKTFRTVLNARRPFDDRAAARSLLPSLLVQGTERDPDRPALARRMELLYGAAAMPSTGKIGESHLLRMSLDSIHGAHAPGSPDMLGEGLELLADLMVRPRRVDGSFPSDVFERERTQAAHHARAVFNDKMAYAAERAVACACEGEPFALPEHGGVEAIEGLSAADVEASRVDFLERGEMWVLALGALPEHGVLDHIGAFAEQLPTRTPEPVGDPVEPAVRDRRSTVERVDVQQSKQVLVFRLPWTDDSRLWMARVLFANMLGGGPHSRLFRVVREEQSLAYYAHAVVDRHKGLLQIHVGLDEKAAENVESEVARQIESLATGSFDAAELDTARAGVLSTLAAVDDSISDRLEFTSRQWQLGLDRTPEQAAEIYAGLQPAEVAAATEGMWLDHSYLLAPSGGGQ